MCFSLPFHCFIVLTPKAFPVGRTKTWMLKICTFWVGFFVVVIVVVLGGEGYGFLKLLLKNVLFFFLFLFPALTSTLFWSLTKTHYQHMQQGEENQTDKTHTFFGSFTHIQSTSHYRWFIHFESWVFKRRCGAITALETGFQSESNTPLRIVWDYKLL